jgi:hypothetical protein
MTEGGYHFAALKGTTFMDPQVIADTARYLNSDLAATVTGVTIPVDAGHLILTGSNASPVRSPRPAALGFRWASRPGPVPPVRLQGWAPGGGSPAEGRPPGPPGKFPGSYSY